MSAPQDEIRQSVTVDVRGALPAATTAVRRMLAPADDQVQEEIAIALGRQIGLLKMGAPAEVKEEWIGLLLDDLAREPAELVLDALPIVRRSVKFEGEVLPAVIAHVEPRASKLRAELDCLERLADAIR